MYLFLSSFGQKVRIFLYFSDKMTKNAKNAHIYFILFCSYFILTVALVPFALMLLLRKYLCKFSAKKPENGLNSCFCDNVNNL
jgi:hypothetical protein